MMWGYPINILTNFIIFFGLWRRIKIILEALLYVPDTSYLKLYFVFYH